MSSRIPPSKVLSHNDSYNFHTKITSHLFICNYPLKWYTTSGKRKRWPKSIKVPSHSNREKRRTEKSKQIPKEIPHQKNLISRAWSLRCVQKKKIGLTSHALNSPINTWKLLFRTRSTPNPWRPNIRTNQKELRSQMSNGIS